MPLPPFIQRGTPTFAPTSAPASTPKPITTHVSASQLKTASLCLRKWWFEKCANVKQGGKYHFHFGKVLHGYLERYQLRQPLRPAGWDKGLRPGDAGWIEQRAEIAIKKGIIRAVTQHQHVEYQLAALIGDGLVDARGLPLLGKSRNALTTSGDRLAQPPRELITGGALPASAFDLGYFTGFMDGLDLTPESPGVFDHKTAKNRTYAKTKNTLGEDEQMLSYAAVLLAMPGFTQRDGIWLRHNIFLKDPEVEADKAVYQVEVEVTAARAAEHWRWVIETAKAMKEQRMVAIGVGINRADNYEQVPSALQRLGLTEGKRQACECYGGCPFKKACLGYGSIQTVVAELDAEVKRVDQYGNDPSKKTLAAFTEKSFKSLKDTHKNNTLQVSSSSYSKGPKQANKPQSHKENFMFKKAAPTPASNPPQLTVGSYAWVKDPEESQKAYRCNILAIHGDGAERLADIYLYADSNGPVPVTSEMRADQDRLTQVPFTELSMGIHAGRGGYDYHTAPVLPAGESIPGTPIPTAGQVSINTPDATTVLAQAADAPPAANNPLPAANTRRPGRPSTKATPTVATEVQVPPAVSPQQLTVSEAADIGAALSGVVVGIEKAALEGIKAYVDARLAALGGAK